jgi:hypothetical protein
LIPEPFFGQPPVAVLMVAQAVEGHADALLVTWPTSYIHLGKTLG